MSIQLWEGLFGSVVPGFRYRIFTQKMVVNNWGMVISVKKLMNLLTIIHLRYTLNKDVNLRNILVSMQKCEKLENFSRLTLI